MKRHLSDDYEILPHEELEYLRREVERLKKNPLGETHASASLLDSMRDLNANVKKLVEIMQSANDDMVKAFHENSAQEQLRKLREENLKIAKGIVALSKMIKDVEQSTGDILPRIEELTRKDEKPDVQFHDFNENNPFEDHQVASMDFSDEPPRPPGNIPKQDVPPPPR